MVVEWGGSRETNNDAMAKLAKKMCRVKPDKLQQQFGIAEEDAKFLHSVWKWRFFFILILPIYTVFLYFQTFQNKNSHLLIHLFNSYIYLFNRIFIYSRVY